jgi:hypothetical protein
MKQINNFIHKYKKEIIVILILIIIIIFIYYFYNKHNYEGFFTTTTNIIIPTWDQLGITIPGEAEYVISGWSVSLSADGTIVAIGTPYNSDNGTNSGQVRIYQLNGTNWDQLGDTIPGEAEGDENGMSVSLSDNGMIVAIGAPYNDGKGSDSGHVRVFDYDGTNWNQLGETILGEAPYDQSGYSVSLSADGTIVAIGSPYNDGKGSDSGQVRIFKYNETSWVLLGAHILGTSAGDDYIGWSVSLSADGKIVAIGAPRNDGKGFNSGQVRIFQYNESNEIKWGQLGETIIGTAPSDYSGSSVSLSADGTIVAIGSPYNDGKGQWSGHVRIFQYNESNEIKWGQLGEIILGTSEYDQSGTSVSLSDNGMIVAIGAPYNDSSSGQVRIYQYNETSWVLLGAHILGTSPGDQSGRSVSLSADGTIVAIGEPFTDHNGYNSGQVRLFKISPINCIGSFVDKGVCSTTCGPGDQEQEYKITSPAQYGGASCSKNQDDTRIISCNLTPCPIDCIGSFGDYDTCSEDCGGGTQTRTYTITQEEKHNGNKCPHTDGYTEDKECNPDPCPINCVGDFVPFKDCSRECDGGIYQEIYNITKEAQYGGVSCKNKQNDLKTSPCNTQPCPIYAENTTLQEALKESNNKIQNIRYNIIDRQEELDTLTNKFNLLNKNISFLKHNKNYVPDDKTLKFY